MSFEQTPVYIYDSAFSLLAVVDDYQTLRFKHGWYQPGDFELTINKNTLYASSFARGCFIRVGEDNTKCGVVYEVNKEVGPEGALSEIITVKGYELLQLLDRRIIIPPAGQAYYSLASTTPAETVVKSLIKDSMGATASANRKDSRLTVATDLARGSAWELSARYDNLLRVVSDCLLATSSGLYATMAPGTGWTVEFSTGTDRSTTVVFSTDRETTKTATLRDSEISYRNMAIVAGQGDGINRTIVTYPVSEPTGLDRRELFVDARDLSLTASLTQRGLQKLSENGYTQFIDIDALTYSTVVYGVDYFVGDKVSIQQFDQTFTAYITSAEESWSKGVYNIKLGFDRSQPTLPGQVVRGQTTAQKTANATELPTGSVMTSTTGIGATSGTSLDLTDRLSNRVTNGGTERKHIRVTGIADVTTTPIFTITTTDESGGNDGGGYTCYIRGVVGHGTLPTNGFAASKAWSGQFSRAQANSGAGVSSAVENVFSGTSAATAPATRDIGAVTVTTAETSEYVIQVSINIDLTGSSVNNGQVSFLVEVVWTGYLTPPVIA